MYSDGPLLKKAASKFQGRLYNGQEFLNPDPNLLLAKWLARYQNSWLFCSGTCTYCRLSCFKIGAFRSLNTKAIYSVEFTHHIHTH